MRKTRSRRAQRRSPRGPAQLPKGEISAPVLKKQSNRVNKYGEVTNRETASKAAAPSGGLKRWDEVLRRLPPGRCVVAEVGVWQGKMSKAMLMKNSQMLLWMVDRWECPDKDDSYYTSGSDMAKRPQDAFDNAYSSSKKVAQAHMGRATIVKMDSDAAATRFENEYFDLVFIDGDHSYEGVKRDVKAWLPKVKRLGWIGGHDYDHPNQGGVKKAIDEIFAGQKIELGGNRTWFVRL